MRAVYVNMSSCPCGYPVCFMDCLIALLLYETEWMVSYLSSERCKIWWNDTNGMWESLLLTVSWQSFEIRRRIWTHARKINQWEPFSKKHVRTCLECARITFAGHVVLAGCGEASAAMAVDGCYPELVPALRSQVWQNHIFWKSLKTHNWQSPSGKKQNSIYNSKCVSGPSEKLSTWNSCQVCRKAAWQSS